MNELDRVESQALREAVVLGGGAATMAGGALCVRHDRVAMPELNRAIPLGKHVDAGAIAAWYDGHPHYVCAPPGYLGLAESLAAAGYEEVDPWVKLTRGDAPVEAAATDLRIEQTLDAAAFGAAVTTPSELGGFVGAPGWLHFVAWDGDEPVASGAIYAEAELAWVGVGATRPTHRGRGAQSAILAARIEAGRSLGVTRFASETGNDRGPSFRNLQRAGFHEAYVRPNWRFQPSR